MCTDKYAALLREFVMRGISFSIFTILVCFQVSCAPPEIAQRRYFWPPPPDEPKIEYIVSYVVDADLRKGSSSWVSDMVLGHPRARELFLQPQDVASDERGTKLYVSDVGMRKVVVLDLEERKSRFLKGDPEREWLFFKVPLALCADDRGGVFVSDMAAGLIYYFGPDERVRFVFGNDLLERVTGMAVDSQRGRLYAVDAPQNKVVVFDLTGKKQFEWGSRGAREGEFNFPLDIAIGPDDNLYVLDALNFRIQVFSRDGVFLRSFGRLGREVGSFRLPKAIAIDRSGNVYVTDSRSNRVLIFNLSGQLLQVVGGYGRFSSSQVSPGAMSLPAGIDANANDTVWVADTLNRAVHRFQYLNEQYLEAHPVQPDEAVRQ